MARQPKTAPPKQKFNKGKCKVCFEDIIVCIVNGKLVRRCDGCHSPTV
jgi:hypothetical protein